MFDERVALMRVYRGFKLRTLWYPSDGSEPMLLHAPSLMHDFLLCRILLAHQLPIPRELCWHICYAVYWGDVANVITDVYTNSCVRKKRQ